MARLGEPLVADRAVEGLLAGVAACVDRRAARCAEQLVAVRAAKRLLAGVDARVLN